jgi:hypothetical protein
VIGLGTGMLLLPLSGTYISLKYILFVACFPERLLRTRPAARGPGEPIGEHSTLDKDSGCLSLAFCTFGRRSGTAKYGRPQLTLDVSISQDTIRFSKWTRQSRTLVTESPQIKEDALYERLCTVHCTCGAHLSERRGSKCLKTISQIGNSISNFENHKCKGEDPPSSTKVGAAEPS